MTESLDLHPKIDTFEKVREIFAFVDGLRLTDQQKYDTFTEALRLGNVIIPVENLNGPNMRITPADARPRR